MLYALIVLYNKKCENSLTIQKIKKYDKKINIIVFDNSTSDYQNKQYCQDNHYIYYTENKNMGLSKAYNYVISKIEKNNKNYIMILDDDTDLTDKYFEEVFKNIKLNYEILLPIVYSNNKIISPSNIQFNCRVKRVKKINNIDIDKITAINSGMVVRTDVYNQFIYNDALFLDYVDHDFMKNVRNKKLSIHIMNTSINQSFSRDEQIPVEKALFRFKIYKKDFRKYCKNCKRMMFYYANVFKLIIINLKKYKRVF